MSFRRDIAAEAYQVVGEVRSTTCSGSLKKHVNVGKILAWLKDYADVMVFASGFYAFFTGTQFLQQWWWHHSISSYVVACCRSVLLQVVSEDDAARMSNKWEHASSVFVFLLAWPCVVTAMYCGAMKVPYIMKHHHMSGEDNFFRRKIQDRIPFRHTKVPLGEMLPIIFRNYLVFLAIHAVVLTLADSEATAWGSDVPVAPWSEVMWQVCVCYEIGAVLIRWSHAFIHMSGLYEQFHKLHHQTFATSPLEPLYVTLCELLIEVVPANLVGPLLLNANWMTVLIWLTISRWNAIHIHTGFTWPTSPFWSRVFDDEHNFHGFMRAEAHWIHHQVHSKNYGPARLYDHMMGTEFLLSSRTPDGQKVD